jgi:hypothetical protein
MVGVRRIHESKLFILFLVFVFAFLGFLFVVE